MKQKKVALSSTEAEYLALSEAGKLLVWLQSLLSDFECADLPPTTLFEDNQGAIVWGMEGVRKAKHVAVRQNFVKQLVHDGLAVVVYCPTAKIRADIFTKPLARTKFEEQRKVLMCFSST